MKITWSISMAALKILNRKMKMIEFYHVVDSHCTDMAKL